MTEAKIVIGFIGLGAMGSAMSARLAEAGFALTVLDSDQSRCQSIAANLKARAAASPREVAQNSDVIITMLPNSHVVEQVLSGPDGLLAGLKSGALIIEMSSGVPTKTRDFAALVRAAGGSLIDAPVSGGVSRALNGTLAIMVGGTSSDLARAEPALKAMGTTITQTGDVGSAHAMKALNNLVSAGGFLIGIEALLIGAKFGLDTEMMVDVLNASTGMNNSTQKKFKQFVLSRKFDAGFGLDLMVKDLGIALGLADGTQTPTPFAALCEQMWAGAAKTLGPGRDHTEVARFSEMMAGTEL
jgi:3-hydroxyisobutyrate dehydrogenase